MNYILEIISIFLILQVYNQTGFAQLQFEDSGQKLGNEKDQYIKLADIDNDGDLDAIEAGDSIKVRLNDSAGHFTLSQNIQGHNMDLADLDGDSDLDMFITFNGPTNTNHNQVWINDGAGFFKNSNQELGIRDSRGIALDDLDNDGDIDAFVANHMNVYTELEGGNQVFFNDGNGIFTNSGQELGNDWSNNVALGDIDNDGDLDAVVANNPFKYRIGHEIWLNNNSGYYSIGNQHFDTILSNKILLGDVDNDNDLDIFIIHADFENDLYDNNKLLLNNGNGIFTDSEQIYSKTKSRGGCFGDVDNDGDLDIFVVQFNDEPDKIWLNNGEGLLIDSCLNLNITGSADAALGDLDNDGDLDAYIACDGANKVYFNTTNTQINVNPKNSIPCEYNLHQNYPNPFNPSTRIQYTLGKSSPVNLSVYNTLGQKIKTLVNSYQNVGEHSIVWDGIDQNNNPVCSGIYFYCLKTNNQILQNKMLLVR